MPRPAPAIFTAMLAACLSAAPASVALTNVGVAVDGQPVATLAPSSNGLTVSTSCTQSGADVTLVMTSRNDGPAPVNNPVLKLGTYSLPGPATGGTLCCENYGNLTAWGSDRWYPSQWHPSGVSTVVTPTLTLATYATSEGDAAHLAFGDWVPTGVPAASGSLWYWVGGTIPPGGSRQVVVVLRFSRDLSAATAGYEAWRHATDPAPSYSRTDARPAIRFQYAFAEKVTPANPRGFDGDWRRLDAPAGAAAYLAAVVPAAKAAGAGAVDFWDFGYEPGAWYPLDNWANYQHCGPSAVTVVNGLRAAGLEVGVCVRCDINWADAKAVAAKLAEVRSFAGAGFTRFYLDSFGGLSSHLAAAKLIRQAAGPTAILIPEYTNDRLAALVCQGVWSDQPTPGQLRRGTDAMAQVARVAPGFRVFAAADDANGVARCRANGWVPWVPDVGVGTVLGTVAKGAN